MPINYMDVKKRQKPLLTATQKKSLKNASSFIVETKSRWNLGKPAGSKELQYFTEKRIITPAGINLKQRTFFSPGQKNLTIQIVGKSGVKSALDFTLHGYGGEIHASGGWLRTEKEFQNQGFATQMLTEAIHVMKKAGVKTIRFQAIGGHSIYRKLGFEERHQFGDTYFTMRLNN